MNPIQPTNDDHSFELLEQYKYLRVVDVCDAMDGIGYFDIGLMSPNVRPLWSGMKFWGIAFTIRCIPANRPMWRLNTTEEIVHAHGIWFKEVGHRRVLPGYRRTYAAKDPHLCPRSRSHHHSGTYRSSGDPDARGMRRGAGPSRRPRGMRRRRGGGRAPGDRRRDRRACPCHSVGRYARPAQAIRALRYAIRRNRGLRNCGGVL